MFKDSPEGQTHYYVDGCKDEHGMTIKQRLAELKEKRRIARSVDLFEESGSELVHEFLREMDDSFPDIMAHIERLEAQVEEYKGMDIEVKDWNGNESFENNLFETVWKAASLKWREERDAITKKYE